MEILDIDKLLMNDNKGLDEGLLGKWCIGIVKELSFKIFRYGFVKMIA